MRAAIALGLLLLAAPATAQEFELRFLQYGAPVEAVTHEVRLGQNGGNAVALAIRLASDWKRAELSLSPTQAVSWPVGTGDGPNPGPLATYDDLQLWTLGFGAGVELGPFGLTGMIGSTVMTCQYSRCGSSPLFNLRFDIDWDLCLGSGLQVCARAGIGADAPRKGRYTWLADRAGREPDSTDHGLRWFLTRRLGVVIRL